MKKIMNFLNKLWVIIRSKLRNKEKLKGEEWYEQRLEACGNCEYNSIKNMKEVRKSPKEYMIYLANNKQPYCMICKCEIDAKASEKLEECSDNKNKKWKAIDD